MDLSRGLQWNAKSNVQVPTWFCAETAVNPKVESIIMKVKYLDNIVGRSYHFARPFESGLVVREILPVFKALSWNWRCPAFLSNTGVFSTSPRLSFHLSLSPYMILSYIEYFGTCYSTCVYCGIPTSLYYWQLIRTVLPVTTTKRWTSLWGEKTVRRPTCKTSYCRSVRGCKRSASANKSGQ